MNILKNLRQKAGITICELSLKTGVVRTTLSAIENGRRAINLTHAKALADFFHVSVDYITGKSFEERLSAFVADCERDFRGAVVSEGTVVSTYSLEAREALLVEIIKYASLCENAALLKEVLNALKLDHAKKVFSIED